MDRKISNIYDYLDYRILLNDDFILRSTLNKNYSLRSYARDIELSAGFISEVLRAKKDISANSAKTIFGKIGFVQDELVYAKQLLISKTTKDEAEKNKAQEYIDLHHSGAKYLEKNDMDLIIKSPWYMLIYGLVRKLSEKKKIFNIVGQLGLSEVAANKILQELIAGFYIYQTNEDLFVKDDMLQIKKHSRVLEFYCEYSDLIVSFILQDGGLRGPGKVAHSLLLGLTDDGANLVNEALIHYIKTLHRIAQQTPNPDRFVLVSNLVAEVKL